MKTPDETVPASYDEPHEVIGRFVVLCSMLDYRLSQLLSRWFTPRSRVKFLSNLIHSIDGPTKREIIAERLSLFHPAGERIAEIMEQVEQVLQRRDLAVHGVLTAVGDDRYVLKNLGAHKALEGADSPDALDVGELPHWSQEAMRLTSEIVRLSQRQAERAA